MLSFLTPWASNAGAAVAGAVTEVAQKLAEAPGFSQLMYSESAPSVPASTPAEVAPVEAVREEAASHRESLQKKILQRLQAAGVSLEGPLPLEVDAFGDLRVAPPGHAQVSQIELLLNDDPGLARELSELESLQTELEKLELRERADRLHPLDPRAAAGLRQQARHHTAGPLQLLVNGSK